MHKFALSLMALGLTGLAVPALADNIPYANVGHVAPTAPASTVTMTGNTLSIYFYGSSAADTDDIEVKDITQGWTSGPILDNHSSTPGQVISFSVNPNDVIEFFLVNQSTGETYSSDPADSADGFNHAYMTSYTATGSTAVPGIPPGTFVGFEDLYIGANSDHVCGGQNNQSDCDYNDDEFVFADANAPEAPEPGSLALLGTSILGVAGIVRRRFVRR